jgi:hypothetical protein
MPTDSILVVIGVCVMFLVFATALVWADHTTTRWVGDRTPAKQKGVSKDSSYYRDAA